MFVFLVIGLALSGWFTAGLIAALAWGQAIRAAEAHDDLVDTLAVERRRAADERAEMAGRAADDRAFLIGQAADERRTFARQVIALASPTAARNAATLDRSEQQFDPDADFRQMLAHQARMNAADEHGAVPIGMD